MPVFSPLSDGPYLQHMISCSFPLKIMLWEVFHLNPNFVLCWLGFRSLHPQFDTWSLETCTLLFYFQKLGPLDPFKTCLRVHLHLIRVDFWSKNRFSTACSTTFNPGSQAEFAMDSKSSLAYEVSICNLSGAQSRSGNLASRDPYLNPKP